MINDSQSVQSLRRAHAAKITRTTTALDSAILYLREHKLAESWSKEDLWRAAGLKSGNALKNPHHRSFLEIIERHNDELLPTVGDAQENFSSPSSLHKVIETLRDRVVKLKEERNQALELNGMFQREADYHSAENRDLLEKIRQLMQDRDEWKNKFVSNWQKKT